MANNNFDLPRPTAAVPNSTSAVINDNAKVLDYVINSTGTVTTRTGKVLNTLDSAMQNIGFTPASFDFATGGTLTDRKEAVFYETDGNWYSWGGALPKTIAEASSPSTTGGVAAGAWNISTSAFMYGDWRGFSEALYAEGDITDNGLPDTPSESQRLSALKNIFTRRYSSIVDLKASAIELKTGQTVMSPLTKWQISTSPTYSMPYANRTRTFNSLSIGDGKYAIPYGNVIYASDFLDESVTASNDVAVGEISSIMRDGMKLDFIGKMYRVYGSTVGIPSASATPATSRAQLLNQMLYLYDLRDISFGSGGLYAANQSSSGTKSYYPSTVYLKQCVGVHFGAGSVFESKGESWGDSDASFTLSKDDRQDFLGQNGGHAVVAVRCKTITGSPTCRFSGSVGPLYFSSCEDIRLVNPFSNPASLGYAAFSFDAWVGTTLESGLNNFHGTIHNPVAHAETLTRREDGLATGAAVYCGKGGVLTEDFDVIITSLGGSISDMYANGSAKNLGYAFGAGVHSKCISIGAVVRNCQEVAYANVSADGTAECVVTNVDAVVGLTGCMFDNQSFGVCRITLKGKVRVNNSRVWAGDVETLSNTSLVASMKPASSAYATIDCDAGPDENPPSGSQGLIFSLISNKSEACYGGVVIEGGKYVTNGYLIRSEGWGGASLNSRSGLIIKASATITDLSTAALDGFLQYRNQSSVGGIFTYIYHDLEHADISLTGFRPLDTGYLIFGSGLVEKFLFPRKLGETSYLLGSAGGRRPRETLEIEHTSVIGLSGLNTRAAFVMTDGRAPRGNSFLQTDAGLVKVITVYSPTVAGPLRAEMLLEGDVRANFTALKIYTVLGG